MGAPHFLELLRGGDLRSIGKSTAVFAMVSNQSKFDELWTALFSDDRLMVMRAADVIEKVTLNHPEWLHNHVDQLILLAEGAKHKELKWHLAQLLGRVALSQHQLELVWNLLSRWLSDPDESRIVRVFSLQTLADIDHKSHRKQTNELRRLVQLIKAEKIPSLTSRIAKLHL